MTNITAAPINDQLATADSPLGTRKDFPICRKINYLDNAFMGPLPTPVLRAAQEWYRHRCEEETDIYEMFANIEKVRTQFARMINATPEEIGFLYTTSEGENIICNSLDLGPGDNIVTCDLSYPHVGVLGQQLQNNLGVDFRIVRHTGGAVSVDDFSAQVDHNTRLIVVPWVSNISAFRHNIKGLTDLAHEHGAYLYVDAIQLVGTEPVDVKKEGLDFLCCGTYKWLMSGWGIAPIYIRKELLEQITPDRFGWQPALWLPSHDYQYTHLESAAKFEYASPSFDQFYQLSAALGYLENLGLDQISRYSSELINYLRRSLEDLGFTMFTPEGNISPSLTFWVGAGEKEVDSICHEAGIRVGFASGSRMSETYGDNPEVCRVRISPAHYNLKSDLDKFLIVAKSLPRCDASVD